MTRIISGTASSLTIKVPKSGTRPTSDRVREAMFSTLDSWDALEGMRVLDLFAGTGALGIESASRGALEVQFVEKHPPAAAILKINVDDALKMIRKNTNEVPLMKVHRGTATGFIDELEQRPIWDLVFIDPPYDFASNHLNELLKKVAHQLRERAVVMVERSSRDSAPAWPSELEEIKTKKYGETTLWWAERVSP